MNGINIRLTGVWSTALQEEQLNDRNECDLHSRKFVEILCCQLFLSYCAVHKQPNKQQQLRSKRQLESNGNWNPIALKLERHRKLLWMQSNVMHVMVLYEVPKMDLVQNLIIFKAVQQRNAF